MRAMLRVGHLVAVMAVGLACLGSQPSLASATPTLGGRAEAMAWLERIKDKVRDGGPEAAAEALRTDDSPFARADVALALSRLDGDKIFLEAHSMYPLIQNLDVTDQVDSEGRRFAHNLLQAARQGGGTTNVTNRVSGEGGKAVELRCYAEWAPQHKESYFIISCFDESG